MGYELWVMNLHLTTVMNDELNHNCV